MDQEASSASSTSNSAYSDLIQSANDFMISEMAHEARLTPSTETLPIRASLDHLKDSAIAELFGIRLNTLRTCSHCHDASQRLDRKDLLHMIYPPRPLSNEPLPPSDFLSVLRNSIIRKNVNKTVCRACKQLSHVTVKRDLFLPGPGQASLPPLLSINTGVKTADHLDLWQDGPGLHDRFLRPSFAVVSDSPAVTLVERATQPNHIEYRLQGMVLQIQVEGEPAHLVTLVDS